MSQTPKTYDAIILGSGQAGNPLSQKLAGDGRRVALIESRNLGGTCINTGCTPTKTMVASAQVAHYARHAERWGVKADFISVDLEAVLARKNKIVGKFRGGWQTKVEKAATLDLHWGEGKFVGPKQIEVAGQILQATRIFIDTGTSTIIPEIPGLDTVPYLTNETLMELPTLPDHLLVIGAGYIGLEFGQMYRRFGSEVTIVQNSSHILGHEDKDVIDSLKKALEAEGIRFLLEANITEAKASGGTVSLNVQHAGKSEVLSGTHLLLATGRKPKTAELDLDKTGVMVDKHGYINVNSKLETSVEGIWAMGDVKGGPAFTHISYNDYQIVYGNLYEGKDLSTKDRIVPYAVFTDPQLGRVGMTEGEATAAGKHIKVGSVPMKNVARAIERGETHGLMKIVVDAENDQILGASILSSEGAEVVQILHTLMLAKQPYTLLKGAIYIHPTIAEGFFSLLEAVK